MAVVDGDAAADAPFAGGAPPLPGTDRGFTLIELMIVIAIIAIITSIAIPNLMAAKLSANETSAIATLRNLASAQAMIQGAVRIDVDNDAIGEYGTFLELSGVSKVRRGLVIGNPNGSDFSALGQEIKPPVLSASLSNIDQNGFVTKAGYAFMMFLPDSGLPALWVHEVNRGTRDLPVPDLATTGQSFGGTGTIGLDLSENIWVAYAIPVTRGNSGNRAFFSSQQGDVLQSPNDVAKHGGTAVPVDGNSAFRGSGITSKVAVGTKGNDDDVWKVTN